MAGSSRNWSGDQDFIFDVAVLRRRFMECCINQDLFGMISSIKLLFYVCEPKILNQNPEEDDKKIKNVESQLWTTVFVEGASGRTVETDGTRFNKKILINYTENIFRSLLIKLQKAGIYTRNVASVKESLGDFEGS